MKPCRPENMHGSGLTQSQLWEDVQPKAIGDADVRETLVLVERGEADAGIVYATDAQGRDTVRVVAQIDPSLHKPIRYPLLLIKQAEPNPAAERFFDLATGPVGRRCFRFGFTVIELR